MPKNNTPTTINPLAVYLPEEAADRLRVERRTIYKLIDEGQLPKREYGKGYKLLGEDLLKFLGSPTITPQSMQPNFTAPATVGAAFYDPNTRWKPNNNLTGKNEYDPTKDK